MSDRISLPKDRIRVLLLEGVSESAVELLASAGYENVPLRIFSHRDENLGDSPMQNKRMFSCRSNDAKPALDAAFNAHENWFWVSLTDPRAASRNYESF